MEILIFLAFIGVCFVIVMWATHRSSAKKDLENHRRREKAASASKLYKKHEHGMPDRHDPAWRARQRAAFRAQLAGSGRPDPEASKQTSKEYDGYSRRDRHRVVKNPARVKKEGHMDDLEMTKVDFTPQDHKPAH